MTVRDSAGTEARLIDRESDGSLTVRVPDGRRLLVPAAAIERIEGTEVRLAERFEDLRGQPPEGDDRTAARTIPIVVEEAEVEKRTRATEKVRVRTQTDEREEEIEAAIKSEHVDVERVPVERIVDSPEVVREEGDKTIIPLHEEVLVVEKRLMLKEELHLTKREEERREARTVRLRRESAEIERTEPDEA